MNISFENQIALVTGAGSGIGLATAKAFADSGATVVLVGAHEESVKAGADSIIANGGKALAIQCNVADENQVKAMVEQVVNTYRRLDVAINNAGVQSPIADTADASGEEFDRVIGINLKGV
jgi:Short-chain alcohol dehydrogenase of unknown specificity